MQISVTDAKGQLTELVRRAEAGDEIILTRHGHAAVLPVKAVPDRKSRRALLEAMRASAPSGRRSGHLPREARIFSTAMMACLNDRGRYLGADGDRS